MSVKSLKSLARVKTAQRYPALARTFSTPCIFSAVLCLSLLSAMGATEGIYDASGNLSATRAPANSAPILLVSPQDQIAATGEAASFSPLLKNPLGCGYQWRFFETNLPGRTQETLLLLNVSAANEGPYRVAITNGFGSVTSAVANLYIDADRDALPNSWEQNYFAGTTAQRGAMDSDGDGVSNFAEFQEGTNPTNKTSFRSRLTIAAGGGGTIATAPQQPSYAQSDLVNLTAFPFNLNAFEGWTGDLTGKTNPASLLMSTNRFVRGLFECFAPQWGIASWWRGESSGNDFVGTNQATFYSAAGATISGSFNTNGLVGTAIVLYGTNYLRAADSASLRPTRLTLEAWVYPTVQSGTYQTVVARGATAGDDNAYYLGLLNGVPHFWSKHGGMQLLSGGTTPLNQWTHLAGTFDGSTKRLYVNGVQVAQQLSLTPLNYDAAAIPITLGADWVNNAPAFLFNGLLDEITVFNRALSALEISLLFNDNAAGKCRNRPILTLSPTLADARQGVPYSVQVTSTLGALPATYSLSAGMLPAGLSLSTAGLLSGTPTQTGSNIFAITATDSAGVFSEIVCGLQVLPAEVPAMPAGLIGWWRLENNALDSVGTNHGSLKNGAGFTTGKVGSALSLDGVDDSVEIPDSPTLRATSLTAECWVLFTNVTGVQIIFSKPVGSGFFNSMVFWLNNGDLRASIGNASGAGETIIAPFAPVTNRWYHIAHTFDEQTRVQRLYLDGQQVAFSSGGGTTTISYDANPWLLGRETEFGAPSFFVKGRIDEASLFNRPLTAAEVQSIFNAGASGKLFNGPYINTAAPLANALVGSAYSQALNSIRGTLPVTLSISGGALPPGLTLSGAGNITGIPSVPGTNTFIVRATDASSAFSEKQFTIAVYSATPPLGGIAAWWRAEGNGLDAIGTNHGALQNGVGFAGGNVGQAFLLNGVNQSVVVPDSPALRSASFTLESWVWFASAAGTQVIFAKPLGAGTLDSYALYLEGGTLRGFVCDTNGFSEVLQAAWSPVPGQWYHVAYAFDERLRKHTLFLNGSAAATGSANRAPQFDANALCLGRDTDNGSAVLFLNGRLDEASIYTRALTAAEIGSLWSAGAAGRTTSGPYMTNAPALPEGMAGLGYTQAIVAARGSLPITYSVTSGVLPVGLTLSAAGTLSGLPTVAANSEFVVRATDSTAQYSERAFSLRILPNVPSPAGIAAWWRAEGNTQDAIGGAHGIPVNEVSYGNGRVGQAFVLDGVNDAVRVPDSSVLRPSSFTIEAWVWFSSVGGTRTIFSKPLGGGTLNSFVLSHVNNAFTAGIADINGAASPVTAPLSAAVGEWYHVAFTFDEATKQQVLYINGAKAGHSVANRSIGYDSSALQIGRDIDNGSAIASFAGRIDEPAIYNRALSAAEIASLYSAASLGKLPVGPYFATPPILPDAVLDAPYLLNLDLLRQSGGATFSIASGALPQGLSLASNGTISGTPSAVGALAFRVQATDASGVNVQADFTLTVVGSVPPPSGIVSWWRAENDGLDAIGTNHGSLMNGLGFAQGKVGSAFILDGTDTSVDIPDSPGVRPASLTCESWVMFNSVTGLRHIFGKPISTGTFDSIAVWYDAGLLRAAVADLQGFGTILSAPFTPVLGHWYHIAYAFDHEDFNQALYIDGLEVAASPASKPIGYDSSPLLLGRDTEFGSPAFFMHGRMDEPALYNRALDASEIFSVFKAGAAGKAVTGPYFLTHPTLPPGIVNTPYSQSIAVARAAAPISFQSIGGILPPGISLSSSGLLTGNAALPGTYTFSVRATDNLSGTVEQNFTLRIYAPVQFPSSLAAWWRAENNAADSIGTNHGVLSNSVTFASGKVGSAFELNGIAANVQVPDSSGFFNRTTPFSVETWIKAAPQQPSGDGLFVIVDKSHGYADGAGWALQGNANGTVSFFIGKGGSGDAANFIGTNTLVSVLDNRWHHLVGVYNGSAVAIYMDGVLHASRPLSESPAGNNRNLSIGRSWGGGTATRHFRGLIDEVSFYTNSISEIEIAGLYTAGPAGKTAQAPIPPILLSATAGPGTMNISFEAAIGHTYYIQYKTNLEDSVWLDLSNFEATSNNVNVPITPFDGSRFYRVYAPSN